MTCDVMIFGLGNVGERGIELLARTPGINRIIGCDINEKVGAQVIYSARVGATHSGLYPDISFLKADVNNIDSISDLIARESPKVIWSVTTLQSPAVAASDLQEKYMNDFEKLYFEAGFAPWLPLHVPLVFKLMKAVKQSKVKCHVVGTSYGDGVHAILAKVGLAPTVGLGNFDHMIPEIRHIVADKVKSPITNVKVWMVAHHALINNLAALHSTRGVPYFLKIASGDKDVTDKFNLDELLLQATRHIPSMDAPGIQYITGCSGAKHVAALLRDSGTFSHAPGPNGLPGGYPVMISSSGVQVVLPDEISLRNAIRINEEAAKHDGIEKIEDDGSVIVVKKCAEIMRTMVGFDMPVFRLSEMEAKAAEFKALYKKFLDDRRR
jgi:hypothetical protein